MNYLWDLCFREEVQTISSSLRLLGHPFRAQADFCYIVGIGSGFVLMNGIGNVDNTSADIWYFWIELANGNVSGKMYKYKNTK